MSNLYTKKISLTVSRKDKQLIKRAAKMSGVTMAAFIRDCAEVEARWILGAPKLVAWIDENMHQQVPDAPKEVES
jgi:uncharacterized protein (DUF1778 family)